jgi:FkbM family methyltransferase
VTVSLGCVLRGVHDQPVDVGVARKGHLRRSRKLIKLLREKGYRVALRAGVAAAIEHEKVAFRHDFSSIIDVGAHQGQFALLARRRYPGAMLYCIEPLTEARTRLERILINDDNVAIIDVAAADRRAETDFHVSRSSDSSSLLPITKRYTTAFPGTETAAVARVRTERLDEFLDCDSLRRPVLLKIDVQGAELAVLRGTERLLRCIDEVFVECSFVEFYEGQPLIDDVVSHLHERAFRLSGIYSVVYDGEGRCLQADLLFTRRR